MERKKYERLAVQITPLELTGNPVMNPNVQNTSAKIASARDTELLSPIILGKECDIAPKFASFWSPCVRNIAPKAILAITSITESPKLW